MTAPLFRPTPAWVFWESAWLTLEMNSTPEPNTGCRLWLCDLTPQGYPKVSGGVLGLSNLGHRQAVEIRLRTKLPGALQVHHLCHQRSCIEPNHLVPLTRAQHYGVHAGLYVISAVRGEREEGKHADELALEFISAGRTDNGNFYFGSGK